MKRSEIIDYIKASAAKLGIGSLTFYETIPVTDDLVDEDIPCWKNVNDVIAGVSTIPVWVPETYAQNAIVRKEIDGIWYLFASQIDDNNTEPSLTPGVLPWTVASNQYGGNWTNSYPFLLNDVVVYSGRLYLSLVGSNTGHTPNSSPTYWQDLGVNQGTFDPAFPDGYSDDDAVFYDGYSYSSNINDNTYLPTTDVSTMAWDLIGENPTLAPNKPKEITVDDGTQLDGDADGWYYTIPFVDYSAYGNYPDIRVYRDSSVRIWMDYTNNLSGDITLPLPDVSEDGLTQFPYLIIITK